MPSLRQHPDINLSSCLLYLQTKPASASSPLLLINTCCYAPFILCTIFSYLGLTDSVPVAYFSSLYLVCLPPYLRFVTPQLASQTLFLNCCSPCIGINWQYGYIQHSSESASSSASFQPDTSGASREAASSGPEAEAGLHCCRAQPLGYAEWP